MFFFKKLLHIKPRLVPIDFTKPWWQIILSHKGLVVAIAMLTTASHLFWSISPFLIAYVFESASILACGAMFTAWFLINLAENLGFRLNTQFQLQIIHSIHQSAHQQLLVVDPRYHTHRSSGAILGKIDRAARGYEDLLDQILLEFSPTLVGLVTTVVALAYYSLVLSMVVACLFAAIIVIGYFFAQHPVDVEDNRAFSLIYAWFQRGKRLVCFPSWFGKQGYPVLGISEELKPFPEDITINAENISFDYETAKLFNNHSLSLTSPRDETNKLYGIIGASGSGKTTLLSILGGQLKPDVGCVKINDIDIYKVNDRTRRHLIAIQGQTASTLQATVKYNLLFGLPHDHGYSDDFLLNILDRVGLLNILNGNQGLLTQLGEQGLNLSGEQRQRVNFASLYLRAQFYRPALILIDEPTSSLDEISELAITNMIMELAYSSLTIVIAHRIKTVANAKGLIDLSLLSSEKNIRAYPLPELEQRSVYYSQLASGRLSLDS